ncbi:MAG: hypothetical protein ACKVOR_05830 [Flavobacteriales bacterium]
MKNTGEIIFYLALCCGFAFLSGCDGNSLFNNKEEWPCDEGDTKCMRFVQYGTSIPVEGAQVLLYSYAGNEELPSQVDFRTTDANGYVIWPCELAITDICGEAEGYWDNCGYGYDMNMTWVADEVYELLPEAWAKVTVSDSEPFTDEYVYVSFPIGGLAQHVPDDYPVIRNCVGNKSDFIFFYIGTWNSDENYFVPSYKDSIAINATPFDTIDVIYHY